MLKESLQLLHIVAVRNWIFDSFDIHYLYQYICIQYVLFFIDCTIPTGIDKIFNGLTSFIICNNNWFNLFLSQIEINVDKKNAATTFGNVVLTHIHHITLCLIHGKLICCLPIQIGELCPK